MSDFRQVPKDQLEDAILQVLLGNDGAIEVPEHSSPAQRAEMAADEMIKKLSAGPKAWWEDAT